MRGARGRITSIHSASPMDGREGEQEGGEEAWRQTVHLGSGAKKSLLGNNERSCMRLI